MGEAKRRAVRAAHDMIAKGLVERGQLIAGGWRAALLVMGWDTKPRAEQEALRIAYFSGAQHLFGSMMAIMDEDREPTEADEKIPA